MRLFHRGRNQEETDAGASPAAALAGQPPAPARDLPDPSKPPQRRGTWEEAALVNVDITEVVKRQLGSVTPPWKK